jgi:hypothetical protein
MSHRNLVIDPNAQRQLRYNALPQSEVDEALWEALATLSGEGIDLGVKAELMLARRLAIKSDVPKPS